MQRPEDEQQAEAEGLSQADQPGGDAVIPWQQRGKSGLITAFVRTAVLVMSRNGRLADHLDMPLDYSKAKRFRWMAVALPIILPGVAMLGVLGPVALGIAGPEMEALSELPAWLLAVLPPAVMLLTAIQWGLWTGMVGWFFASRKLDPQRRHRAAALAYYLSAPLAMLAVPMTLQLYELTSTIAGHQDRYSPTLSIALTVIWLCVMVYWLQMILFAARDVVGRRVRGLVATGLGLPLLWVVTSAMVWLAPWGLFMWVIMHYSLSS